MGVMVSVSASHAVITASTLSTSAGKIGQVLAVVCVFFAVLLLIFFAAGRATGRFQRPVTIAVFVGPAIVLMLIGLVIPSIRTFYLSFHGAAFVNAPGVGWKNYQWAFTDPGEQSVLLTTLLWLIVAPIASTGLGLLIAIVVDRMKRQAIVKSLIFMPMAISFVGASIIWKFVYDYKEPSQPQTGLLSQIVIALGWSHPPNWLLSHPANNFLLMVIMIWIETGFAMVVLSAAIKAIPDDVIEAARVDGAHGLRLFRSVQIPMIRATLVVVLTTVMIATLKIFDIVRTVTGGNFGTNVLANDMYSQTFVQANIGRGSALAVIILIGVLPLVAYNVVQLRKERATR
jgi:alpha-glucoside transport system permease protein